jgi:hypothetical protein
MSDSTLIETDFLERLGIHVEFNVIFSCIKGSCSGRSVAVMDAVG